MPSESQARQKVTGLGMAATNPGQHVNAGDGPGGGANRTVGVGALDEVGVGGGLAARSGAGVVASQRLQATVIPPVMTTGVDQNPAHGERSISTGQGISLQS